MNVEVVYLCMEMEWNAGAYLRHGLSAFLAANVYPSLNYSMQISVRMICRIFLFHAPIHRTNTKNL